MSDSDIPENGSLDEDDTDPPEGEEVTGEEVLDDAVDAQSAQDQATNVLAFLPTHAAPRTGHRDLTVQRRRGRPRKVERAATVSDLEYHAKMAEEKAKLIDADSVVQAARKHAEPMAMLSIIKVHVAEEAAALRFQRIENEKLGKDTAQVSSRRIDALKKIADIELEIKKLGGDTIDVNSEKMLKIFEFFIMKVKDILADNLNSEQTNLVFNRLETEFSGWQEKLEAVLR